MAGALTALQGLTASDDVFLRVTLSLIILVVGHLGVKTAKSVVRKIWIDSSDLNKKQSEDRIETLGYLQYVADAGVIFGSLVYLNSGITTPLSQNFISFIPNLLTVGMAAILGAIGIKLFTKILKEFLRTLGAESYLGEMGLSGNTLDVGAGVLKVFLYMILLQAALEQLGIGEIFMTELVRASSWAIALLAAGLALYGFKDLFKNLSAGLYLKNSRRVRPGEEVRIGEETGEIGRISLFSTELETEEGFTVLKPNRRIMESEVRFKRTKNDLETLEEVKNYFVAQSTDSSRPAVFEMAMDILGYRTTQEELSEDDERPEEVVERKTNREVRICTVESGKISNLGDELKAWFNDGAVACLRFRRNERPHNVLVAGVEQEELLVIDPDVETGGVFFMDQGRITDMMEDEDGYTVIAPKGTTSYWRIEKGLIYSDRNYYDELSKTLEARLNKIMRQGRLMKDVMPDPVRDYVEEWRSGRYATKLWQPEEAEDETSENT